uniref:No apical meristem-associated C-terminal domain-containing protein n=1 Tax=Oryza brachyantha TaxID=4533 RepID=J3MC09_ORYBR
MGGGQPARRGSRPTKSASSLPQSGATQQGAGQVRLSAATVTMAAGRGRPPTPPSPMVSNMAGMGDYMNLVNEDINHYDLGGIGSQPEDEQPPAVDCTSVKPKQKRSKNFSDEEDELLVSAWLNVSLDPVSGSDQPKSTYWNRIYDYYHSNKTFISERNENSLMHRWSTIQEAVNKYCGYVSKIQERNESGVRLDQEMQARIWYKKDDEHQRTFNCMNCYHLLKNQQKWMV